MKGFKLKTTNIELRFVFPLEFHVQFTQVPEIKSMDFNPPIDPVSYREYFLQDMSDFFYLRESHHECK